MKRMREGSRRSMREKNGTNGQPQDTLRRSLLSLCSDPSCCHPPPRSPSAETRGVPDGADLLCYGSRITANASPTYPKIRFLAVFHEKVGVAEWHWADSEKRP